MTRHAVGATPEPYPVRVVRSRRRKRSVSARLVEGVLELTVPSWLSEQEATEFVNRMQARFARKRTNASTDLTHRSAMLAKRYDLPAPTSVRWVSNQQSRWGSCSVDDGSIRLSDRMVGMPHWVVDAVLVHELAHLVHADHGAAFQALEARYERQGEASAFLDGVVWANDQRPLPNLPFEDCEPSAPEPARSANTGRDDGAVELESRNSSANTGRGDGAVELESLDGHLDLGQLRLDLTE